MTSPKIIVAVVMISAIGGGSWWFFKQKKTPTFYYAGTVEATKVDVPARLATVISNIEVSEGAKVQKGQNLVALECEDLKIQNKLANDNFVRGKKLLKSGSMPRDQFEQIQSRNDEVALKLAWCAISSPINGTVLTRYREPGEWVAPGMKLMTLADLDKVWAYVYVPQPMLADLKIGMSIPGFLPEINMRQIDGVVVKMNEEAEFTPKNVQTREERTRLVYGIKIQFKNDEGLLKPGMPIEVDLPEPDHG